MNLYDDSAQVGAATEETLLSFEEYQEYKAQAEDLLAKAKMAAKLSELHEFKEIIMRDYFEEEPKRLGLLMASGRLTKNGFDDAAKDLACIGHLKEFLQGYIQKGNIAQEELEQLETARNEAIAAENGGKA